ncbi:unnamed protein product, partial [Didymodactylos carnosus]
MLRIVLLFSLSLSQTILFDYEQAIANITNVNDSVLSSFLRVQQRTTAARFDNIRRGVESIQLSFKEQISIVNYCAINCLNPGSGRACIPKHWMCDGGAPDCQDGSDEDPRYCGILTLSFQIVLDLNTYNFVALGECNNNETRCVNPDLSRETIMPTTTLSTPRTSTDPILEIIELYRRACGVGGGIIALLLAADCQMNCLNPLNGSKCFAKQWLCDGILDCADASDEDPRYCARDRLCTWNETRCVNPGSGRQCIPKHYMCDGGSPDCQDASDEDPRYCGKRRKYLTQQSYTITKTLPPTTAAGINYCAINCLNPGSGRACIPKHWMCDGGGTCISKQWMCDGHRDCLDGSDEDLRYCAVSHCAINCVRPGNGRQCIPKAWMCDGDRDCSDGSDEDSRYCSVAVCTRNQTRCVNPGMEERVFQNIGCAMETGSCGGINCVNGGTCDATLDICDCPLGYTGVDCSLSCGTSYHIPNIALKIANGKEAVPYSWPWMARINSGKSLCGGFLIDDQHILTAAHCCDSPSPIQYTIYLGLSNRSNTYQDPNVKQMKVERIFLHEQYES